MRRVALCILNGCDVHHDPDRRIEELRYVDRGRRQRAPNRRSTASRLAELRQDMNVGLANVRYEMASGFAECS
jgi:hypothetical protein